MSKKPIHKEDDIDEDQHFRSNNSITQRGKLHSPIVRHQHFFLLSLRVKDKRENQEPTIVQIQAPLEMEFLLSKFRVGDAIDVTGRLNRHLRIEPKEDIFNSTLYERSRMKAADKRLLTKKGLACAIRAYIIRQDHQGIMPNPSLTVSQRLPPRATVERTRFHNPDNGYTVLELKVGKESITATCTLPCALQHGQEVEWEGQISHHPKYGRQIDKAIVRVVDPSTFDGIKAYLSSGIIAGVGPTLAERIVRCFGAETLNILDANPKALLDVKGIGRKSLARIAESWKEKREGATIVAELCNMGLSVIIATTLYKLYGTETITVVKANPYRLADDIAGIGFKTADVIALRSGFEADHPFRIKSGILFVMKECQNDGHCFLYKGNLLSRAEKILTVPLRLIESSLLSLVGEGALLAVQVAPEAVYYLPAVYHAEQYVEERIIEFASSRPRAGLQLQLDSILTEDQRDAVTLALTHRVTVITGAAGTGKTTTLKEIIRCLDDRELTYSLCAPTGKAAARMSEVTEREAKTIHRLISIDPFTGGKREEDTTLECDYVIVDEASMIDLFLFAKLLKALPDYASLVLIGDKFQISPVGIGGPFADLIESGICPITRLSKIQRQKDTSSIIQIASQINDGLLPGIPNSGDSYFFEFEDPEKVAVKLVELATEKIPSKFGIPFNDIMVLSPMKKGLLGTHNLNKILQESVQRGEAPSLHGFMTRDKVMQTQNNYDKRVWNGDVGFVSALDIEEKRVFVQFEGMPESIPYEYHELNELALAYATTVHKAQGGQARGVIVVIHPSHFVMLRRNLFYTAVTRTRELLVLIGSKRAMASAVNNDKEQRRNTALLKKILCT